MVSGHFRYLKKLGLTVCLVFILFLGSPTRVNADDCSLQMQEHWQNKFPFGLVIGTTSNGGLENCIDVELFGFSHSVCALTTLLNTLKNVVLIKFILGSIQNL